MLQVKRRTTTSTHQEHLEAVQPTPRTRGQLRRLGVAQENSPTAHRILKADQEIPSQLPSNSKVPEVEIPVQLLLHGIVLETDKQSFPMQLSTQAEGQETVRQNSPVQLPTYSKSVEIAQQSPVQLQASKIQENIQQCAPVQLPSQVKVQETLQQSSPVQLPVESKPLETAQHSPVQLPTSNILENVQQCSPVQLPSQVKVQETVQQSSPVQLPTESKPLETAQHSPVQLPTSNILENVQQCSPVQLPSQVKVQETVQQSSPVQLPTESKPLETAQHSPVQLPTSNILENVQQCSPVQLPSQVKVQETVQQSSPVQLPTESKPLETAQHSPVQLPTSNILENVQQCSPVQLPSQVKVQETVQQSSPVQLPTGSKSLETETVEHSIVQLPPSKIQENVQQCTLVQLPSQVKVQEIVGQSSPVQLPTCSKSLETVQPASVQLPTYNRALETVQQSSIQLPTYNKALETIQQPPPYNKAVETVHQRLVQLPPQEQISKTAHQTLSVQSTSADQQSYKTSVVYEAVKADKSGPSKQENDSVTLTVHSTSDLVNTEDHFKVDSKRYCGANPEEPLFIRFTELEEKNVVDFLILLYNLGYGFTKLDMARIATEYAVYLRKRTRTQPIVMHWVIEMISKWPELQLVRKKCKLNLTGILTKFFNNLENVMKRCSFDERPELVFSVTDIEIRQDDSESGEEKILTTVIACGSAAGLPVPPFFVFPGQKVTPDLMNEALPGSSGVVSDDGLVNAEVFIQFLNDHLLKNIPEEDIGKPILIHINAIKFCSVGLLDLAKKHNVTLIFPPMEIPNALMPLDVGCIVPFQTEYIRECKKHIQETMTDITINNVCGIVGKIYPRALTSKNIKEGFRKAGLFPCNRDMLIVKRKT